MSQIPRLELPMDHRGSSRPHSRCGGGGDERRNTVGHKSGWDS
jgi:hypothetical protein